MKKIISVAISFVLLIISIFSFSSMDFSDGESITTKQDVVELMLFAGGGEEIVNNLKNMNKEKHKASMMSERLSEEQEEGDENKNKFHNVTIDINSSVSYDRKYSNEFRYIRGKGHDVRKEKICLTEESVYYEAQIDKSYLQGATSGEINDEETVFLTMKASAYIDQDRTLFRVDFVSSTDEEMPQGVELLVGKWVDVDAVGFIGEYLEDLLAHIKAISFYFLELKDTLFMESNSCYNVKEEYSKMVAYGLVNGIHPSKITKYKEEAEDYSGRFIVNCFNEKKPEVDILLELDEREGRDYCQVYIKRNYVFSKINSTNVDIGQPIVYTEEDLDKLYEGEL